jgi:hypothetical protein
MIRIDTLEGDQSFGAYLAEPGGTPRAAVVINGFAAEIGKRTAAFFAEQLG